MKSFKNLLSILFFVIVCTLPACKKHSGSAYTNQFSAAINGTVFTPATIAPTRPGSAAISITGAIYEPEITILELDIPAALPVANTSFPLSKVTLQYGVPDKKLYNSYSMPASGTITFNTVDWDNRILTGTFQGVIHYTATDSVVISNGQFSVQYVER